MHDCFCIMMTLCQHKVMIEYDQESWNLPSSGPTFEQSFLEQTYFFLILQSTSCHPYLRLYANWTQSSFPWLSGCWPHHCFFTSHFVYFHSVQSDQLLWLKSVQCLYSDQCVLLRVLTSSFLPLLHRCLQPTHH